MLDFQIASDLHQEFNTDDGLVPKSKILILAGDIVHFSLKHDLRKVYQRLKKKFEKIIHVPGNHEYYSFNNNPMSKCLREAKEIAWEYGVTILNNEVYDMGKVRIIGSTLWAHIPDEHANAAASRMNDYECIFTSPTEKLTVADTNRLHEEAVAFLQEAIQKAVADGKVPLVVTHHAPQKQETNDGEVWGFATDVQHLYRGVKTWVFGHTHFACDLVDKDSGMRLVSNPADRVMFRRNLVIEI
jgi:predicted phosphohydrolase